MSEFSTEWLREIIAERFVGGREGFDRWLAEVERAAAEKALTDAARQMPFPADPYGGFDHESLRGAFVQSTNWLRDRAEAYRQERKEK